VETPENWTTISSDTHFADDHLSVVTERVRTPHRTEAHAWTIVRRKSAVVVAAMTAEGNFVLVRRAYSDSQSDLGNAGRTGRSIVRFRLVSRRCFARVARGDRLRARARGRNKFSWAISFPRPGSPTSANFLFLACPVQRAIQHHTYDDAEMILECREFSPAQITAMIADDTIRDANTLSIWARLVAKGIIQLPHR